MNVHLDIPPEVQLQLEQIVKSNNTTIEFMLKEFIFTKVNSNKKSEVSKDIKNLSGSLSEYSNPAMWERENTAWEDVAVEKYEAHRHEYHS